MRVDDRSGGVEAWIREAPDADVAVVPRHMFQQPLDGVVGVRALVGLTGPWVVDLRTDVQESTLRLIAAADVLEDEDVSGAIEGFGWTKTRVVAVRTVRRDAIRRH